MSSSKLRHLPPPKQVLHHLYSECKLGLPRIAKRFGVSVDTVYRWCKQYQIPLRPKNSGKHFAWDPPSLAYVVGVCRGDGSTYTQTNSAQRSAYAISLHVTQFEFARKFQEALSRLGLNPKLKCYSGEFYVRAFSKQLFQFLKSEKAVELARAYPAQFLAGLYESEGTAFEYRPPKYRYYRLVVKIANANLNVLKLAKECVQQLGFKCNIYPDASWNGYRLQILGGTESAFRFLKTIQPAIKLPEWVSSCIKLAR